MSKTHVRAYSTVILSLPHSIGISSLSKELFAGYSNQQLVAWVKPRYEQREEQEFEHVRLEPYYTMPKMRI